MALPCDCFINSNPEVPYLNIGIKNSIIAIMAAVNI
jgi:hypothetical protein